MLLEAVPHSERGLPQGALLHLPEVAVVRVVWLGGQGPPAPPWGAADYHLLYSLDQHHRTRTYPALYLPTGVTVSVPPRGYVGGSAPREAGRHSPITPPNHPRTF